MLLQWTDVIKLLLAVLIGGLIGAEREFRDKAAGLRTIMLICVGATLFTMFSLKLGGKDDPARVAANVVSGVGFLGAGAILRDRRQVIGLTTAATIWLAAALGVGIGSGEFVVAAVSAGITFLILWGFPHVEGWIDARRESRTYRVVMSLTKDTCEELETVFTSGGLHITNRALTKSGDELIGTWEVDGPSKAHDRAVDKLCALQSVKEFRA